MRKPTLLTILSLLLSFASFGQPEIEERRLLVHKNARDFTSCDSSDAWLDLYSCALANYLVGDYSESFRYVKLTFDKNPPEDEIGYLLLLNARVLRARAEDARAVLSLDSALSVFSKIENESGVYMTLIDLAEHYRGNESWMEATEYIKQLQVYQVNHQVPDEYVSRFYHRKAAIWTELWDDDSTETVKADLMKSFEYAERANTPWQKAWALLDYGYILHLALEDGSMDYFQQSASLLDSLGYTRDYINAEINIARALIIQKDFDACSERLNHVIETAKERGWNIILADAYSSLAQMYELQGKYKEAYAAYREYHEYRLAFVRQIFDDKHAETMARLGTQSARNELMATANAKTAVEKNYEAEKSKNKLYVVLFIVSIIGLSFITWFYWRTKSLNRTLAQQKDLTAEANKNLEHALDQKDIIYRELHHRVKNNLANLSGLIYLQERSLSSAEAKRALHDTRNRIQAMSAIHKGLYQTDDIIQIDLQSYLEELTPSLMTMYTEHTDNVTWTIQCEGIIVEIDKAVPLAMIINEMLTNSLKYAFDEDREGIIEVKGKVINENTWEITVSDDGPGLPEEVDLKNNTTLGMKLIHVLSEDLGIQLEYNNNESLSTFTLKYSTENNG
ncbi:sensor histidine kinase [Phaeocystidibacter luteus]|uniref:sensor histidine kinase n=1 Tax=Phaeocystidibacter luteus TaxID=911197 RepID=UPI0014796387|nr:sensor histidine kinase [Phaeocystidibacter luteus]